MSKMLVLYYSWSNGNTKRIAEMLAEEKKADIEAIETEQPYQGSYDEVVEQGHREVNEGYMPKIKPLQHDINTYDVIAVGTPTWWYTMAPAVKSFFHTYDLKGKTVIPFMTNGGWPGHVIKDMIKESNTDTENGMEIQFDSNGGSELVTSEREIERWIKSVWQNYSQK